MLQKETLSIARQLLTVARPLITKPEMQESFALAKNKPEVLVHQLRELDAVIANINTTSVSEISRDMINAIKLKEMMKKNNMRLPSVLDSTTHANPELRKVYKTMLQEGDKLLGPFFHFHTHSKDPQERLGLGVLDGYGLFVPFMLGQSPEDAKETQGMVVNALCEMLADAQVKNPDTSVSLFHNALASGWYDPAYGFSEQFTSRVLQKRK